MLTVKADRYPLLPTQCRNRLVEAIRSAPDSHAYAVQEDGGLYDFVEPSQVARLLSEGWQVYRVTLENLETVRPACPMGCDGQQTRAVLLWHPL